MPRGSVERVQERRLVLAGHLSYRRHITYFLT